MAVLADNGGEPGRFEEMGRGCHAPGSGEKRVEACYRGPRASRRRPRIGSAHALPRRALPKGGGFDGLAQGGVNLIRSRIDPYPREGPGWRSPLEAPPAWGRGSLPQAFGTRAVPRDEANLAPPLVGG